MSFTQNESGEWGYKVGGADTVIPFSREEEKRLLIINTIPSKLGLTENSTWDDIANALQALFPDQFDILANVTWTNVGTVTMTASESQLYLSAAAASGRKPIAESTPFDISGFKRIYISYVNNYTNAGKVHGIQLITSDGTVDLTANGYNNYYDISQYSGEATIKAWTGSYYVYFGNPPYYAGSSIKITSLKLFAE